MPLGYTSLVLHAHLPFIRHPEHADMLEERWLFEAVAECYLPLLNMLEGLQADRIPFRMTISFSPTLMAMLDDPLLRSRCQRFLEACMEVAEREVAFTAGSAEEPVAHFYRHWFRKLYKLYVTRYRQDLLTAFHQLAKAGYLDLITCSATHGFLPLLQHRPEAVRAQILVAVQEFQRRFGHSPRGFWLPECGYFHGVDQFLRQAGVQYCFLETHAITHARPSPPRGTYAHAWTPGGVAVFGRDSVSSKQVWSSREGYPGDGAYRDFYRDIGFERDPQHLGRLKGPAGTRHFTGFKYHRVTGPTDQKWLYDRWAAEQTACRHAGHFVNERARQAAELRGWLPGNPPPLIVAPYDAELFGHWWFEGPCFLEQVARQAALQHTVQFITPGDYLNLFPQGQGVLEPTYSSWGNGGYAEYWCDHSNHWMYRHLHDTADRMVSLAHNHRSGSPSTRRALNQAARELLLAQASDWAFLVQAGTAAEYARRRFTTHVERFDRIAQSLASGLAPDSRWLASVEAADNLFPGLQFDLYASP